MGASFGGILLYDKEPPLRNHITDYSDPCSIKSATARSMAPAAAGALSMLGAAPAFADKIDDVGFLKKISRTWVVFLSTRVTITVRDL